jgi:polysaccharide chain length determinant protein (PEP-CTERM system associated)
MNEFLKVILLHLRGLWRFRWIALATTWVLAIGGWIGVAFMPNTYRSEARFYVDSETVLKPLLAGLAVGTDIQSQVSSMARVILSTPNMQRVAQDTELSLRASTPEGDSNIVEGLKRRIKLEASAGNLYTISFDDQDRNMSQRVVQSVLNAFVEGTLGIKRADTSQAQEFLQAQLKDYELRLREAEDRLADFKRRNIGQMPGDAGGYYAKLQAAQTKAEETRAMLRIAESKRAELLRQLEGEEPTFGLGPDATGQGGGAATSTDAQISLFKSKLDALLVQYTDKHPEVVALRETIQRLEQQKVAEAAKRHASGQPASSAGATVLNINPVYQSMRVSLSQTELQLVEVRNQLAVDDGEVSHLRGMVNTVPQVEAELVRLNRDYEVNKAQYQALLQRLESARLSEDADASKESGRFRIVEPPVAADHPIAPNRPLLNTVILLFAIGTGLGLALVLHQINPVFSTRKQLAAETDLPVLMSISSVPVIGAITHNDRRALLVVMSGALVALYIAVIALSQNLSALLTRGLIH